jgi:type I restriction enzyme S subunit
MANTSFWINGTIYWASSGDIKTKILSKTANMITEVAVKQSSTTLLQEGAILIVTRSGILRRYLPVAKNTVPIAINQDIKALIPNNQVSVDYLLQVLSKQGPDILSTCMKAGTTVESVEYTWLKKYQISLPSPSEQRAIATALSDVDALITSLDKLIAKKRDIKQATMQQLLTGRRRLPGFSKGPKQAYKQTEVGVIPEEWDVKNLRDLCISIVDGTHYTPRYVSDGIPFYSVENVTANNFADTKSISLKEHQSLIRRCKPEKGDILLTRIGSLGYTKLVDWDINASIYVSLALLKINNQLILPDYMYAYSKSKQFVKDVEKRSLMNATPIKINMDQIGNIPIPRPSFPEQQAIAAVLTDMDAEISALEQKRDKTRALKQGMMQELLTGKTRLVAP